MSSRHFWDTALSPAPATAKPARCCHSAPVLHGINVQEKGNGWKFKAIPHNSKCRYGERGAAAAKPKAQIILCAAKVSAASGGCSEPKQGQRSQSARGFCPEARCGYRNPTLSSILATQMPCRSRRSGAYAVRRELCGVALGMFFGFLCQKALPRFIFLLSFPHKKAIIISNFA